jgi:hypothetical protein
MHRMSMNLEIHRPRGLSLRAVLAADAALEFLVAATLLVPGSPVGGWLTLNTMASVGVGVVFLVAGAAIALFSRDEQPNVHIVRGLAAGNAVGGLLGWVVLIAGWSHFEPQGRAVLGIASDLVLALAAFEWLRIPRMRTM